MDNPVELVQAYASPRLQSLLSELAAIAELRRDFFLTGGTALSVFFLHHRISEDIDLFSTGNPDLPAIGLELARHYGNRAVRIRQSELAIFFLIDGVKVDLVKDPLSQKSERSEFALTAGQSINLDTIKNMVSNKLCAAVGRREPKDYIDLFFLLGHTTSGEWQSAYEDAKRKDAMFDDPPTVAYQIELGYTHLKNNPQLTPRLLRPIEPATLEAFFENFCRHIYSLAK